VRESGRRRTGRLGRLTSTVRFRITAVATLAVAAVLAATSMSLVVAQRRQLTGNLEDALRQRAGELELELPDDLESELDALGDDDTVAQLVTVASNRVVDSSANADGQPPVADPPDGRAAFATRRLDIEDEPFRILSRRVDGPEGPAVLHIAANLDDVEESIDALVTSLTLMVPAVAGVLAALIWWLVGRTLQPVEAIRAEVAGMGGGELDRRVPEPPGEDEVARLARTMNAMLDRVEEAAHRQHRFVADASHELRSPLTRIRSTLEVDLAHPGTADLPATHRSLLEESAGLERLVEDLLHLARSDAGAAGARREPVDVDDLLVRDAQRLRATDTVAVDMSGVSAAQVDGAVRNLTDNAVRHARSTVTLTLADDDGRAVLGVADDGPGIPADQRERVFERFTRLDDARTYRNGGTGLGLAIAKEIVVRHGGTISVDPGPRTGTLVVVTLPLRQEGPTP
jgi:signal transduction histidine kinase